MNDDAVPPLRRRVVAEAIGTAYLLATVVGSGIMAERLFPGNVGLALLANAIATGAILVAIILALGPVSGAHFNPAVTIGAAIERNLSWREARAYIAAQLAGAVTGVVLAHLMFELPAISVSGHARHGHGQILAEILATFGLFSVILGCSRSRSANATAVAVGAYIAAAYWFTASTSFANPAATLARSLTDTFAGIAPADVAGFVVAQLVGAAGATFVFGWLMPDRRGAVVGDGAVDHLTERRSS